MSGLSVSGRVIGASELTPLSGVSIRLLGPARVLDGTRGVQRVPQEQGFSWTRQLTGFSGSRWDCWTTHIQGKVPGITWQQFRDEALQRNPHLHGDGRLFLPNKAYLLPETNAGPQAMLETRTDAHGKYHFELPAQPTTYELRVEAPGYAHYVLPLVVNGAINQPVILNPLGTDALTSGLRLRSARTDYTTLPLKLRLLIDAALALLGDDGQVFDALPPELRRLCYGAAFVSNPNHPRYKDFACADIVSIAFKAAGCDIAWPSAANPHMADYYHPDRGSAKLIEVRDPHDWLPGDVLVYGSERPDSRAKHVNVYVGPFAGIDRSGKTYRLAEGVDVVEGSLEFHMNGRLAGTGIIGCNLQRCLQAKRGYTWVRHVRLRELASLMQR